MLVLNRFVRLALLTPVLVNALAFHIGFECTGLRMTLVFAALEIYRSWIYHSKTHRRMLAARVSI